MAEFGVPTESPPKRVDELIDSRLMAKLEQVDMLSRKITFSLIGKREE